MKGPWTFKQTTKGIRLDFTDNEGRIKTDVATFGWFPPC